MYYALLYALTLLHDGRNMHLPAADPSSATVIAIGGIEAFDWGRPFRPEPFWLLGAVWAERLCPNTLFAYGPDVPALSRAIEAGLRERGLATIGRLEFWGHGDTGYFRIGGRRYRAAAFREPDRTLAAAWNTLRKRLAPRAVLHFRSCATFHSGPGHAFAQAASLLFNADGRDVAIVGYTRPTGLTQPGGHALRPGQQPGWAFCEGDFERSVDDVWVALRDVLRTISGGVYDMVAGLSERW